MPKDKKKTKEFHKITLRELITELEALSDGGKNDGLRVDVCQLMKFVKPGIYDAYQERWITSTGIYHDESINEDFVGIGYGPLIKR